MRVGAVYAMPMEDIWLGKEWEVLLSEHDTVARRAFSPLSCCGWIWVGDV